MFFAVLRHWGTHYDVLPPKYSGPTSFFGMYMQIAFLPQMIFWVAVTGLVGALVGTPAAIAWKVSRAEARQEATAFSTWESAL